MYFVTPRLSVIFLLTGQELLRIPPGLTLRILRSSHAVNLCALCEFQKSDISFTVLMDWFLLPKWDVFTAL
jgi:hypothetical protein